MNSKVTEKEFRLDFVAKCPGKNLVRPNDRVATAAVEAARAAFGDFAPEAVRLPDRLECGSSSMQAIDLWPAGSGTWTSFEEQIAAYQAARDRYNAYPGLQEAAVRIVSEIRAIWGTDDWLCPRLRDALNGLEREAELDKGPK